MGNRYFIGTGIVNWNRDERIEDRYGAIKLFTSPEEKETNALQRKMAGKTGRLIAVVQEVRKSYHVGDKHHKVYPRTPKKGEEIILGEGMLFFEIDKEDNSENVGVVPSDGRSRLWMNIQSLYRAHFQTGVLYFEAS